MVEVYDAHEQGEVVKKWLVENGSAIVMGLVIAFGGLFGFKQWQNWEANTRVRASVEFEVMGQLLGEGQIDAAMDHFQTLKEDYADSPYTSMAALQMARARIETDQIELSVALYEHVVENGFPKALRLIARERLARVTLDQGDPQKAMQILDDADDISGLESRYAETRGDIQVAMDDFGAARDSYQLALDSLLESAGDRRKLEMKIQALSGRIDGGDATS
jgi:predicted negative regulator of RcsB-dependent stress response